MSDKSGIEWTDATWNPVTGCTKVSPGCKNCYAERFAERWRGIPGHHFEQGFDLRLWPDRLEIPLHWTRPRRIFVNSMSDLFHAEVPDDFIDRVFAVMALSPRHTYQVLTKRSDRMREYLTPNETRWRIMKAMSRIHHGAKMKSPFPEEYAGWPLRNVWLGVSVEDQRRALERIPDLIQTDAAIRWLSLEPLLGPVDLSRWIPGQRGNLDWFVVGGESGPGARPMEADWARDLRDQVDGAGLPFFFKQVGGRTPKSGGNLLDGKTWLQMPGVKNA